MDVVREKLVELGDCEDVDFVARFVVLEVAKFELIRILWSISVILKASLEGRPIPLSSTPSVQKNQKVDVVALIRPAELIFHENPFVSSVFAVLAAEKNVMDEEF